MKITTLNSKNPDYVEQHEIYVGTHTGSFKRLNVAAEKPHTQENLQTITTLNKDSRISAIAFGNDDHDEILVGRKNNFVQVFSADSNSFSSSIQFKEGTIVGTGRYDDKLIAGLSTGKVELLQDNDSIILNSGDHMSRLRQCSNDRKLIATGGKERQNCLKVFDLEAAKEIFKSKNLPNDFLQLEVPIWDSDLGFIDPNTIATCSRYGYVRVYDIRKQRRPILKYATPDEQMSFCSMIAKDNMIYTGSTMGVVKAFDTRKFKSFVHTYKGYTGSVSDLSLDDSGKFLVSSSLDRYVRVHHAESCVMMYQCYVKSKATRILVRTLTDQKVNESAEDDCVMIGEEKDLAEGEDDNKEGGGSDDEYNEMFEKMPTICENDDQQEKPTKRKNKVNDKKSKKKKM